MKIGEGGAVNEGPGLWISEIKEWTSLFVYGWDIHFKKSDSSYDLAT